MESFNEFKNTVLKSLNDIWPGVFQFLFKGIGLILLLLVGWIVVKLILKAVKRLLKLAKVHKLDDKLNEIEIIDGKKINFDTIKIISSFIKWILYITLLVMISDLLGLKVVSNQISEFLSYLPRCFGALVIFTLGLLFANFIKKTLKSFFKSMDLSGSSIISQIVFFIILVFITITALNQTGINTTIITSNITIVLGGFLLAFALAIGLGAREVVGKLLKGFYARKTFEMGQKIIFNETEYTIEKVENISIILSNEEGTLIVPIEDIVEKQISIKN